MGFYRGPSIVRNGLVCYLDAANFKSFRGEPTINYMDTWLEGTIGSWATWADGGGSGVYSILPDEKYGYKIRYSNIGDIGRYALYFSTNIVPSAKMTHSVLIKTISIKNSTSYIQLYGDFGGGGGPYYGTGISFNLSTKTLTSNYYDENMFVHDLGNGWYRIGYTTTFTDCTSQSLHFILYDNSIVEVANPQLEIKDHATPFVNGTRGSTIATGGGWADLSANNNHGEFISTIPPIHDSSNMGSLVFDGTDKRIKVLNSDSLNFGVGNFTIELALNFTNLSNQYILNKGAFGGGRGYGVSIWNNFIFGIQADANTGAVVSLNDLGLTETSVPYHISLVADRINDSAIFYVDGILKSTQNISTIDGTTTGSNDLYITSQYEAGAWAYHRRYFTRIYNRALTESEVLQNYNATKGRFV